MKLRLFNERRSHGFTIVELLVAITVFAAFIMVLMFLYSRSSDSFKITLWKQQRTAESELFWSHMRKHLEEATNELSLSDPFNLNPDIVVTPKPLKFHPDPNTVTGNIMAWNCSKVNFQFSPTINHTVDEKIFFLERNDRTISLKSDGKTISKVQDVDKIEIVLTSINKMPDTFEEFQAPGPNVDAVATVVEISLTLTPPEGYMAQGLRIVQNHKFRANVGAAPDSAPSY